jgi:hypothetical protein
MALISRTVFKSDWINMGTTTTYDAMIDRFIDSVEAEIAGICGQPLDITTVLREFEGDGNAWVKLPYTVPVTLTALSTRDNPTDSWTSVSGGVVFTPNGIPKVYLENRFTGAYYSATLQVGYTVAPEDVQTCAYELAKELWYETPLAAQAERFGVSSITEAEAGVSIAKAIVRARTWVSERLQPYRAYGV